MKTLTKGLIITILLSISLFFGITYVNTYVKGAPNTTSEQVNTLPSNNNNNEQLPPITEPVVTPFYTTLPRLAKELNLGEKINNIGGYGKENVKNYHVIGNSIYIIFETDSDSCDTHAKATNIAVAKMTSTGTLLSVNTLQSAVNESFAASCLYDNGIMIVATHSNETVIYTITTELFSSKLVLPYIFSESILRYIYPYNLLITSYDNKLTVFALNADLTTAFTLNSVFASSLTLVECFYIDNYYLYANINGKGSVIKFSSNVILKVTEICSTPIEEIIPTQSGYVISTIANGIGYLKWYDSNYLLSASSTLASCTNIRISFNGCGYFALIYGENGQGKSYFVCRNGDIVSRNFTDFSNIKQVTNIEVYEGYLYITAITYGANNTAVVFSYDGNHFYATALQSVVGVSTTKVFGFKHGSTIYTLYTTTLASGQHLSNWGDQDVFIKLSGN
ncbi:MAG: hypothetical protein EOM87_03545 [Clostridia bacterium]|nr:hypothetical protein [Clostridia bacterium]